MVQDTQEQPNSDAAIIEQYSGRQSGDSESVADLTISERLSRYEGAELELMRAERALSEGVNKVEIMGTFEDVQSAVQDLKNSVMHYAQSVSEPDLAKARGEGSIGEEIVDSLKSRWAEAESAELYREAFDGRVEASPDKDLHLEGGLDIADDD